MFAGLDTIDFSVEDNRLVFDNEQEYQKCIDFLAQLGDENFPAFEKEIGFDSYRKTFDGNPLKSKLFVDELYQTMLNPDMEIIVGDYLLRENPDAQLTYAFELDKESICNLKSSLLTTPTYTFSWSDNAFAIIEGTENSNLKSTQINYCNVSRDNHRDFIIKSSNWYLERSYGDPYAYNVKLEAKLCFQNTAGFKSIISKIKLVSANYDCLDEWGYTCDDPMRAKFYFESIGDVIFKRKRRSKIIEPVYEYGYTHLSNTWTQTYRPFHGTRRVECYNIKMKFGYNIYTGALAPHYNGYTEEQVYELHCNDYYCQP
jgi:hypothetical protein